jgi:hypothetical protein
MQIPLGATRSSSGSGTLAESLSEIRELLHAFDAGGGEGAPATGPSAPAADEPERVEPDTPSDGAVATPEPIPTAMPQAVPPRRRNGLTVTALAAGGLAVLGAAGLVSAGGRGLPLVAVSTAGKGQAGAGIQPEAMARAALPPRETTSRPQPRETRPGARSQEGALPAAPQGSSRPPMPGGRLPRPAPENSALAERASKFINSYWEQSSASGDEALRYLSSVYAPVVDYYGQQRTRDSILQDKHAFFRRWPIRQTRPVFEAGNPTISCDRARAECEITGLRDFAAANPKRGARSAGVVRYSYKVRFVNGTAQIVAESSKVVAAGASAIGSPATLPPAHGVAVAKGAVMPKPPAETGHRASRNVGSETWRLPPAEARTATPVIALGRSERTGRGDAGRVAAAEHGGAAAAFAPTPAAARKANLAPAAEEAAQQPRKARLGLHVAQRAAQISRRGKPSDDNPPALGAARAIAASPARAPLPQNGAGNRLISRMEADFGPMETQAVPALARQNRMTMRPPARGAGGGVIEPSTAGRDEYASAAAAGWQRPAAWDKRDLAPAGRIEETGGGVPQPPVAGRAEYAPPAAAGWRRPAARDSLNASPDPQTPQTRTIIEGRLPPFAIPPPPPPRFRFGPGAGPFPDQGPGQVYPARWRPRFRAWGPPGPPPRFRYGAGAGPLPDRAPARVYPARWRPWLRGWGPPGPPPS